MEYRIGEFLGLNQARDELLTRTGCAAEAVNVSLEGGALSRAKGCVKHASVALYGGVGSLGAFYQRVNGVNTPRLIAVNAGGVYRWTGAAWSLLYAGAGSGRACFLNYQQNGEDILLLADGVRDVLKWDGSAMTALAGCERKFSQLALHYERVWGAGLSAEPDAVYWSRPFDPEDWSGDADAPENGGGTALIPTWNGGSVTALRTLFDDVLVFKDEDLYRIVGTYPGDYQVVRVHGTVGPAARDTIVSTATACYFLAREGLCVYNGVTAQKTDDQRARGVFARINPAAVSGACAAIWRDTLYLALPLDGAQVNSAVLEMGLTEEKCVLREGLRADCFLVFGDSLLFSNDTGYIYRYGQGDTWDGAAISARWRTPWSDLGVSVEKWFESLTLQGSGDMRLTLTTDRGRVVRRLALGSRTRPARVRLGCAGERFHLTVENLGGGAFTVAPGLAFQIDKM